MSPYTRLSQGIARVSVVAACAFLLTPALFASQTDVENTSETPVVELEAGISTLAREELEETGLSSLQIAIARDGVVVFSDAYGKADVELNVEATPETRYRIASISKWLTATAALQLADSNVLDLDAPIQTYCPEYPEKRWPVSARHLLGHTSGIRHYRNYKEEYDAAESDEERQAIEFLYLKDRHSFVKRYTDVVEPLAVFSDEPLLFEPGTQYLYTSFGYRVLGCVLKGAAGQPYKTILREQIFSGIGMDDTVEDDARSIIPNRASGYDLQADGTLRRTTARDVSENLPAGGHLSTAEDLVLFAQAYGRGDLVSATKQAEMLKDPVDKNGKRLNEGYGLGVMTYAFGEDQLIGHDGTQAGSTTIVFHAATTNISIAIMTNTRGWGWPRMQEFARKAYEVAKRGTGPLLATKE